MDNTTTTEEGEGDTGTKRTVFSSENLMKTQVPPKSIVVTLQMRGSYLLVGACCNSDPENLQYCVFKVHCKKLVFNGLI